MSRYPEADAASGQTIRDRGSLLTFDALGEVLVGEKVLRFPAHGRVVAVARARRAGLAVRRRSPKVSNEGGPLPELIGRGAELGAVTKALESSLPVELRAEPGGGKTAMLRHLAGMRGILRRPVVFLSWRHERVGDFLQRLFESSYATDRPAKMTPAQIQRFLQELHAVVLVDDVRATRADVQVVMESARQCLFVFASEQELLWGEGRTVPLPGLTTDAAVSLMEQRLQRSIGREERPHAESICHSIRGHPLHVVQVAALVREEGLSLLDLSDLIFGEGPTGDELSVEIVDRLTEPERRVLSVLTCLGGAPLPSDLMGRVTGFRAPAVTLNALVRRGLAEREGDRYRLAAPLPPRLESALEPGWWAERVLEQLTLWADHARNQGVRIVEETEAVLWALRWGAANSKWLFVLRLARAVEAPMALGARFEAWKTVLDSGLEAARALDDRQAESLLLHQLGLRDLALGSTSSAEGDLSAALALSQDAADEPSAATTRHHLSLLETTPRPEAPQPRRSSIPRRVPPGRVPWTAIKVMLLVLALLAPVFLFLLRNAPENGLDVSPTRLSFGEQTVGTSRAEDVTVRNAGTAPVSLTIRQDPELRDFNVSFPSCTSVLKGETSCSIRVAFNPSATGLRSTILVLKTGSTTLLKVPLDGVGTPPANGRSVQFSRNDLTFGRIPVGSTTNQSLKVMNSGPEALTISTISVDPPLSDFRVRDHCRSAPLEPGSGCDVTVTFTPTAVGSRKAVLTITDDAVGSPHEVPVVGVGLATRGQSVVNVSPSAVSFGDVTIGNSISQLVLVRNAGTAPLSIQSVYTQVPSDFAPVMCGRMPLRLEPGRTCPITVTFTPRLPGPRTGTLVLAELGAGRQSVPLEGIGLAVEGEPAISLQPSSLDFSQQMVGTSSGSRTITVRNVGSRSLEVGPVRSSSPSFVVHSACSTLAPNEHCMLKVRFSPSAAGFVTGTISISDNAPGNPHSVGLRGTGILQSPLPPGASLSPPNLDFGTVPLGSVSIAQQITVTSTGTVALTLQQTPALVGTGFSLDPTTTTCQAGLQLNAGTSCYIAVVFSPQSAGAAAGTLYVYDDAPGNPQTVTLGGTGVGPPPPSP